jgi:hypothetical protein
MIDPWRAQKNLTDKRLKEAFLTAGNSPNPKRRCDMRSNASISKQLANPHITTPLFRLFHAWTEIICFNKKRIFR